MISVEGGDSQTGPITAPLREQLIVKVLDVDGNPVTGASVHWTTGDGGSLSPSDTPTDERGFARTKWTLGASAGRQRARAIVDGSTAAEFAATAAVENGPMAKPVALTLSTGESSGQTVHPDYVAMPSEWSFADQYLLITPYPNGNAGFENPSIFAGTSPLAWVAPAGVTNPIARPANGYLSDPDVVAVPERGELWVYYRQVASENEVYVIRTSNAVKFTVPRRVASAPNHDLVSPAVVHRAPSDWLMWSVSSNSGCGAATTSVELRRSSDGLDWSAPEKVSLAQSGGYSPWHIDVQWIPSRHEFWAIFNGKTPGSCTTPALFLATSPDGVTWTTYPSPILTKGTIPELADVVYRSTFTYDAELDMIDFWYSGAKYDAGQYAWHTAYQRRARSEVFATAGRKSASALAALAPRAGVPELVDPP